MQLRLGRSHLHSHDAANPASKKGLVRSLIIPYILTIPDLDYRLPRPVRLATTNGYLRAAQPLRPVSSLRRFGRFPRAPGERQITRDLGVDYHHLVGCCFSVIELLLQRVSDRLLAF